MGLIERVWYEEGVLASVARLGLWPFARAFGAATWLRNRLYESGSLATAAAALPVISVGNLTVGGTGKTPFAAWLAARLSASAVPAVALRGYGSDEVEVHRQLNPRIPVVVSADRTAAVREARARDADIVVLDDAFQHRRIDRAADIVLVSAEQVLRPRRLLPAGPWREPLSAASRADLLVVTRKSADDAETRHALGIVRDAVPDVPVAVVHLRPDSLVDVASREALPLDALRGASVMAIAAVGEPLAFRQQLEQLGARVTLHAFRDHHEFTGDEVAAIAAQVAPDGLAVCTLKDAVKLAGRWPARSRLWYVSQQLVVEKGAEEIDRLLQRALAAREASTITAG